MAELRLTVGLPGSGKSVYALDLMSREGTTWYRINWDNLRRDRGMHLRNFNRKEENEMQRQSFILAEAMGKNGINVIVDNTNLNENTRNKWKGVAQRAGMDYREVKMEIPLAECVARDANRVGVDQCGRAVIERMALFYGLIDFPKTAEYVIVDMDGTVADCSHRRHFLDKHDWDSFEGEAIRQDPPRWDIIHLVRMLAAQGYVPLIVSGRSIDRAGKHTVEWLSKTNVPYQHIFMRNGGDSRPDNIVKQEILDKLPKDQIAYVLDDRDQVVKMWRDNGLTCLQVAPGNF